VGGRNANRWSYTGTPDTCSASPHVDAFRSITTITGLRSLPSRNDSWQPQASVAEIVALMAGLQSR
jgi:hypothetical protein